MEPAQKCTFAKGEIEITFIDQKADWITVKAMDNIALDGSALTALGLKSVKPDLINVQ